MIFNATSNPNPIFYGTNNDSPAILTTKNDTNPLPYNVKIDFGVEPPPEEPSLEEPPP